MRSSQGGRPLAALLIALFGLFLVPKGVLHGCTHGHTEQLPGAAVVKEACAVCAIATPALLLVPAPLLNDPRTFGIELLATTVAGIEVREPVRLPARGPPAC